MKLNSSLQSVATAEILPAGQSVQTVEADDAAYFPATQVAQVEATVEPKASENVPSPQSAKTVAALASEYLPAPQSVQTVAPEMGEYFPAPHRVQVPFTGPAFPASQFEY